MGRARLMFGFGVLSHLRIGVRIGLGFALVLTAVVGLGVSAVVNVTQTAVATTKLHYHPFTVIRSLADVRFGVTVLYGLARDAAETGIAVDQEKIAAAE